MAVLTSGEFATARATRSASAALAAPVTSMVTSLWAPSPSRTIILASVWQSSVSPPWNHCSIFPPLISTLERPLERISTVSFVEVSPSTEIRLKEAPTAAVRSFRSSPGRAAASVVTKASMVAMRG